MRDFGRVRRERRRLLWRRQPCQNHPLAARAARGAVRLKQRWPRWPRWPRRRRRRVATGCTHSAGTVGRAAARALACMKGPLCSGCCPGLQRACPLWPQTELGAEPFCVSTADSICPVPLPSLAPPWRSCVIIPFHLLIVFLDYMQKWHRMLQLTVQRVSARAAALDSEGTQSGTCKRSIVFVAVMLVGRQQ